LWGLLEVLTLAQARRNGSIKEHTKIEGRHAEIVRSDGYHTGMAGRSAVEQA